LSRITAAAAHIAHTLAARRSTQPAGVTFRNGLLMTATQSHIDEETRGLASTLANRVDELAQDVASAVRAEVDFYKSTRAVADDDLLTSCTENLRVALKSLEDGVAFDTAPAITTGSRRAAAGVPLPALRPASLPARLRGARHRAPTRSRACRWRRA
jgi:hypothetical protein